MLSESDKLFIKEHLTKDLNETALHSASVFKDTVHRTFILDQIRGRQKMKTKVPSWFENEDILYPGKLSLEQSSSETTAKYKTTLVSGDTFADLTGGLGIDTSFLSTHFREALYVERQEELCRIARHNFSVLKKGNIQVLNEDAVVALTNISHVDCIFIDPARRSQEGRKLMLIQDCEPDILTLQNDLLEKSNMVLIKLSPMLDIKSALRSLNNVSQVHVISVNNECKELLFLLKKEESGEPLITCLNFTAGDKIGKDSFYYNEEKDLQINYTDMLGDYLYEPNASILKAGFYKGVSSRYNVYKLHPDSHLYTSDNLIPDFPGRTFKVIAVDNKLPHLKKANLTVRNYPLKVDDLRKKLKLKDGGEVYLFATTLASGKHVLVETKRLYNSPFSTLNS